MPVIITTQIETFETEEERDHYIKEHMPLDFDDKVQLLKNKKIEITDTDQNAVLKIEMKEEA